MLSGSRDLLLLAGLAVLVSVVLFTRLGAAPITEKSEDRCYEVALGMAGGNGYLVPVMDGQPRLNKPPLYYWLVAGTANLLGACDRFALRLPAAVSALALLIVVFAWTRVLAGRDTAVIAALMLALMLQFFTLGRRGVAEMPLALFDVLALASFEAVFFRGRRAGVPWFALWLALAFLAKATTALLFVVLPVLVTLLLHRSLRRALSPRVIAWLAGALLVGCAWYIVILITVPNAGQMLYEAAMLPMGVEAENHPAAAHFRPLWFYLGEIWIAAAPVTVLLPLAVWRAGASRFYREAPRLRFVAIAFVVMFLGLSILPQKQKHYLISLLPLSAILIADALVWIARERPRVRAVLLRGLSVASWMAVPVGAGVVLLYYHIVIDTTWLAIVPLAAAVVLPLALAALWFPRWPRAATACLALGLFLGLTIHFGGIDVWKRQVEVAAKGDPAEVTEVERASFVRWREVADRHPLIARTFHAKVHPDAGSEADGGGDDGN
jgi:4-amino-4-deoxy-L-arabinose transferase-like glycosyltransferase